MFERIVIGVDGTPEAHDAVALGSALADAYGAQCSLVHVFAPSLFPIAGVNDTQMLRAHAERALRSERRRLAPTATTHVINDTSTPRGLRHHAEHWGGDLVVIGSAHGTPEGHARIGRRSRQLIWDAPYSIALARRGLADRGCELRSISVGYDGEPEAEAAFDVAAELAAQAHTTLHVFSVVDDAPHSLGPFAPPIQSDSPEEIAARRDAAIARARARAAALSVPVDVDVDAAVGDPGARLHELSAQTDLIVIGSRRWGTYARMVSGSVGETLVGDAACSVLIVPRPPQGAGRHRAAMPSVAVS